MYWFWMSPLKLRSVLQSVSVKSSQAIVINTCTNLVLGVHIALTSITFGVLLILHVFDLHNWRCPPDQTVYTEKKLLYMQMWKLTRGQMCCWKRTLHYLARETPMCFIRPKQGRCLLVDATVTKIQEKDCLSCTTQYNERQEKLPNPFEQMKEISKQWETYVTGSCIAWDYFFRHHILSSQETSSYFEQESLRIQYRSWVSKKCWYRNLQSGYKWLGRKFWK